MIIPTFNRPVFLKEAVASVLSQSYSNYEIIIIDDHSASQHEVALDHVANSDQRILMVRNESNFGVSAARNTGLKYAKGDYILFLDDDDCIKGDYFGVALRTFQEQSGLDVITFPAVPHPSSNKKLLHYHILKETLRSQPFNRRYDQDTKLLIKYPPQINSMVFRKEIFQNNKFDQSLAFGEDMYLWIAIVQQGFLFSSKVDRNSKATALIRIHGSYHLSQTTHEDVMAFFMKLKKNRAVRDSDLRSMLDLKIFIRLLLMKRLQKAMRALLSSLRQHPKVFLLGMLSQIRVKANILLSFGLYKLCKLDV